MQSERKGEGKGRYELEFRLDHRPYRNLSIAELIASQNWLYNRLSVATGKQNLEILKHWRLNVQSVTSRHIFLNNNAFAT